ncbi:helix-turn-helix domain-containing protein [Latilactobacillus curvatus]
MATLKDRIKQLASEHAMSIAELERKLNFANGSISKWDKQSPSMDRITLVADFFNVSTDYLIGREKKEKDDDSNLSLLAAHIDDDATEEDIKEIMNFIDYIKNRKK